MTTLLKVEGLSHSFGKVKALDGFDLEIQKGDIYGLIGQNGAGKSTFMKVLAGLLRPSAGKVVFAPEHKGMGTLIEHAGYYPNLTAMQNLKSIALLHDSLRFELMELLQMVNLEKVANEKVKRFSLGMKQRFGIAMSLVGEPDFIILDEPINGLDPQGISDFRNMVEMLNKKYGISFIISSHILTELSKVCNKFTIMKKGKVISLLTKEDLDRIGAMELVVDKAKEAEIFINTKLGYQVTNTGEYKLTVNAPSENAENIKQQLLSQGIKVMDMKITGEDLEEVYLNIMRDGEAK